MDAVPPHSRAFLGVRFVLAGFRDDDCRRNVGAKLVGGGGVDVGRYGMDCTHVIVDGLVYDDPVCVAARRDGKTVVTGLWVDHSYDIGMAVDAASIMYRPLKDMNGIPGAASLMVCLTGYQRQDRDDIMTMVRLMGAQFSKPLVASKVTHLICYKFEGEKYELATKMRKIKLVNHQWLEDCLREWEILPETNYSRSGYELEMEAEAKDSEEEEEDKFLKQCQENVAKKSPILKLGMFHSSTSPVLKEHLVASSPKGLTLADQQIPSNNKFPGLSVDGPKTINSLVDAYAGLLPMASNLKKESPTTSGNAGTPQVDAKFSTLGYSQRTSRMSVSPPGKEESGKADFTKVIFSRSKENVVNNSLMETMDKIASSSYDVHTPSKTTGVCDAESNGKSALQGKTEESSAGYKLVDGPKSISSLLDADAGLLPTASDLKKGSPTTSGKAGTPQVDAKFSRLGYSRRTSRMSVSPPGKDESGNADFTKVNFSRSSENVVNNSLMDAMDKIASSSYDVRTPSKTAEVFNAESKGKSSLQGKTEVSSAGCKLPKMSSSPSVGSKLEEMKATVLMDKPGFASSVLMNETTGLHCAELEKIQFSVSEAQRSTAGQIASDLPSMEIIGVGPVVYKDDSKETSHTSSSVLPNSISGLKHVIQGINDEQREYQSYEKSVQPQLTDGLSPRDQETGIATAFHAAEVYFAEGEKNKAVGSTERKKIPGKKTLGRKRNVPTSANVKGSIYLTKGNMESDNRNPCDLRQEVDILDKSSNADRTEIPGLTGIIPVTEEANDTMQCKEVDLAISHEMDDETEAPEDIGEPSYRVNLIEKTDVRVEETSEVTDKAVLHGFASDKLGEAPKQDEAENPCHDQLLDGPKRLAQNPKNAKGSKRPLSTRKLKANHVEDNVTLDTRSSSCIVKQKIDKKQSNCKSSVQVEKENQPLENSDSDGNKGGAQAVKTRRKKRSIKKDSGEINPSMKVAAFISGDKTEPACFIMSGERQQRMQLRKIIRSLKGKLCMDSHRWSYQATHFICPKPVRTEKWFATCASGRWILQPEYLSASNQEGRFLDEEPYEWHKTGLSQDGAINLEAPRKWRLLRRRTGHGALYDMRVIVYGECIAPPLETLKRVVKAGDGTILATSPPYTRFLNNKTDFAVICPGMPRVDAWIQEFLKYEIPCVVADYLVEYVCKPGYSLDKHVLYNTHSWAEQSFSRLQGKAEEVTGVATPNNEEGSGGNIGCGICGSFNREEVMLVCGDEAGSVGCGTAAHIDCCDPQLEAVPEEDWLCPKCSIRDTKKARSVAAARKRKRRSR